MKLRVAAVGLAFVLGCAGVQTGTRTVDPPIQETFPDVSESVQIARHATFEQQNPGWKSPFFPVGKRVVPGVMGGRRYVLGPAVSQTAGEASTKAVAFFQRNAELLGYDRAEIAQMTVKVEDGRDKTYLGLPRLAFIVALGGDTSQRGYERFPSVARHGGLTAYVLDDGEVGSFTSLYTDSPVLHIRTTPKLSEHDSRVTGAVVGRPLYRYDVVGVVPGTYSNELRRTQTGVVAASAVRRVELTITVDYVPTRRYMLAYAVHVENGAHEEVFLVDPDTGALLRDAPPPDGRIVP